MWPWCGMDGGEVAGWRYGAWRVVIPSLLAGQTRCPERNACTPLTRLSPSWRLTEPHAYPLRLPWEKRTCAALAHLCAGFKNRKSFA